MGVGKGERRQFSLEREANLQEGGVAISKGSKQFEIVLK